MLIILERRENGKWRATREDMPNATAAVVADTAEEALEGMLRFGGWNCSNAQTKAKG